MTSPSTGACAHEGTFQQSTEGTFQQSARKITHPAVIRLSLGKLLVNQLQVVKRTNTPLKSFNTARPPSRQVNTPFPSPAQLIRLLPHSPGQAIIRRVECPPGNRPPSNETALLAQILIAAPYL